MNVTKVMTSGVVACSPNDTLNRAAQIMWENDCGFLPVVDERRHVVGVITDRDICMGAYTQGKPLAEVLVFRARALRAAFARGPRRSERRLQVADDTEDRLPR